MSVASLRLASHEFRVLPGLPSYGPRAIEFPSAWGRGAREGLVVEFNVSPQSSWVGNFAPGLGGLDEVRPHPDGSAVLVITQGRMFYVDPAACTAVEVAHPVFGVWALPDTNDLIMSRQDIAFFRVGPQGVVWHTRRLSWDGFRDIRIDGLGVTGDAWSPVEDCWMPFRVDVLSGRAEGGSYTGPAEDGWEQLAVQSGKLTTQRRTVP